MLSGALKRAMDIIIKDVASVIYACFVLHNFCGLHKVSSAIDYDNSFQPVASPNNFTTDCNEAGGNKIRRILTKYLDP